MTITYSELEQLKAKAPELGLSEADIAAIAAREGLVPDPVSPPADAPTEPEAGGILPKRPDPIRFETLTQETYGSPEFMRLQSRLRRNSGVPMGHGEGKILPMQAIEAVPEKAENLLQGVADYTMLIPHSIKEQWVAPLAGLGEMAGLVPKGVKDEIHREYWNERLVDYLAKDPTYKRLLLAASQYVGAGALKYLPAASSKIFGQGALAIANKLGFQFADDAMAAAKLGGATRGVLEGALIGLGETAGFEWEDKLKLGALTTAMGGTAGYMGAGWKEARNATREMPENPIAQLAKDNPIKSEADQIFVRDSERGLTTAQRINKLVEYGFDDSNNVVAVFKDLNDKGFTTPDEMHYAERLLNENRTSGTPSRNPVDGSGVHSMLSDLERGEKPHARLAPSFEEINRKYGVTEEIANDAGRLTWAKEILDYVYRRVPEAIAKLPGFTHKTRWMEARRARVVRDAAGRPKIVKSPHFKFGRGEYFPLGRDGQLETVFGPDATGKQVEWAYTNRAQEEAVKYIEENLEFKKGFGFEGYQHLDEHGNQIPLAPTADKAQVVMSHLHEHLEHNTRLSNFKVDEKALRNVRIMWHDLADKYGVVSHQGGRGGHSFGWDSRYKFVEDPLDETSSWVGQFRIAYLEDIVDAWQDWYHTATVQRAIELGVAKDRAILLREARPYYSPMIEAPKAKEFTLRRDPNAGKRSGRSADSPERLDADYIEREIDNALNLPPDFSAAAGFTPGTRVGFGGRKYKFEWEKAGYQPIEVALPKKVVDIDMALRNHRIKQLIGDAILDVERRMPGDVNVRLGRRDTLHRQPVIESVDIKKRARTERYVREAVNPNDYSGRELQSAVRNATRVPSAEKLPIRPEAQDWMDNMGIKYLGPDAKVNTANNPNVWHVSYDGVRHWFQSPPSLTRQLEKLQAPEANVLVRASMNVTNFFRTMATTTWNFLLKNPVKDLQHKLVLTRDPASPFILPYKVVKSYLDMAVGKLTKDPTYIKWSELWDEGHVKNTNFLSGDHYHPQKTTAAVGRMAELDARAGMRRIEKILGEKRATRVKRFFASMPSEGVWLSRWARVGYEGFKRLAQFTENLGRKEEFFRQMRNTGGDVNFAFNEAQRIGVNFPRMGKAVRQKFNPHIAFTGAKFGESYQIWENLANPKTRYKTLFNGFAYLTIPALYSQAKYWDDQYYQNLPEWQHALGIPIMKKYDENGNDTGKFWFIPLPPGLLTAVFSYLPRKIVESARAAYEEKPGGALVPGDHPIKMAITKLVQESPLSYVPMLPLPDEDWMASWAVSSMPNIFRPILIGLTNYDPHFGRPIVSKKLEGLPPPLQSGVSTSNLSKMMAQVFDLIPWVDENSILTSPAFLDATVSGYFAGWGRVVTSIFGNGMHESIMRNQGISFGDLALEPLETTPSKGFGSKPVRNFFDLYGAASEAKQGLKQVSPGRIPLEQYVSQYPEVNAYRNMDQMRRVISDLSKTRQAIYDDKTMAPADKDEAMFTLDQEVTWLATAGLIVALKDITYAEEVVKASIQERKDKTVVAGPWGVRK